MTIKPKQHLTILGFVLAVIFQIPNSYAHNPFDFLDPVTSRISIMKDSLKDCKNDKKCYEQRKEIKELCDKNSVDSSLQSKYCIRNVYRINDHTIRKEVVKLCEASYTCIDGAANLYVLEPENETFIQKLKETIKFCNGNDYCVYTSHRISNKNERKEIIQLCNGNGSCTDAASQIKDHATRKETITLCKGDSACILGINNISNTQGGYELVALCQGSKQCVGTIGTLSHVAEQNIRIEIIKKCNREASCIRDKYNDYYNKEIAEIKSFIDTECKSSLSPYSLYLIKDTNKRKKITRDCKCNKRCINQSFKNIDDHKGN